MIPPTSARIPEHPAAHFAYKLRRDAVYLKTEKGITFRSRKRVFALNGKTIYQSFVQLLPYLDGNTDNETLLSGVTQENRAVLSQLLNTLLENGVLRIVDQEDVALISPALARVFEPQIDFISHCGEKPNAHFLRMRHSRILLCGNGLSLLSAGIALLRNGLAELTVAVEPEQDITLLREQAARLCRLDVPSAVAQLGGVGTSACDDASAASLAIAIEAALKAADFDLLVYCAEQPDLARLQQLNGLALTYACPFLPAYTHAGMNLIGPMVNPHHAGCWQCTMLRWADNAPSCQASATWQVKAGLHSTSPPSVRAVPAQILGNSVAQEAFKYLLGQAEPESANRLLVQDIASLGSSLKMVLPHPACPQCAGRAFALADQEGPANASTVLLAWQAFLDERFGKFRSFADESIEQLPLRLAQLRLSVASTERQNDPDFVVSGWSLSNSDAARMHALCEALAMEAHDQAPIHLQPLQVGAESGVNLCLAPASICGYLGKALNPSALRQLSATRFGDGFVGNVPAGSLHPCFDQENQFDPHGAGLGVAIRTEDAIVQAALSLGVQLAIAGMAAQRLVLSKVTDWRGQCGKDTDYLLNAAHDLGCKELEIGLVRPYPGLICAVLQQDGALAIDSVLIASGLSHAQAVTNLLLQVVAQAQLAAHGLRLRLPRRTGLFAATHIQPIWGEEIQFDATQGDASSLAQTLSDGGYALWSVDVSTPDVLATHTVHVVKVVLAKNT